MAAVTEQRRGRERKEKECRPVGVGPAKKMHMYTSVPLMEGLCTKYI
jgi:hypothetical protein